MLLAMVRYVCVFGGADVGAVGGVGIAVDDSGGDVVVGIIGRDSRDVFLRWW